MSVEIQKVGLGFAEFVSQLIHETFDAILDAQNYQLERFEALEASLRLPDDEFFQRYLDDEDLLKFSQNQLGFDLVKGRKLSLDEYHRIKEILESNVEKKLNVKMISQILEQFKGALIEQKKLALGISLEQLKLANIGIESGELKSKIDLYSIEEISLQDDDLAQEKEPEAISDREKPSRLTSNTLKTKRYLDKDLGINILTVDKKDLEKKGFSKNISNTRIIANPTSKTSSNFSSEITIRFKNI